MDAAEEATSEEDWDAPVTADPSRDDLLTIDIDGWEGPLDLLLDLARAQKVDLLSISITELVQQYLDFIENARALRLELAADYLVMAAWLAYLKSALLLPSDPAQDPSPEELALRLQLRLQRLDAMREVGARLMARDRLGRDVFLRAAPEGLRVDKSAEWTCSLFDLLSAYGRVKARTAPVLHQVSRRPVWSLEQAVARLSLMIGDVPDWRELSAFLPRMKDADYARSALASTFVAALELARTGRLEIAQDGAFAPLSLRPMA